MLKRVNCDIDKSLVLGGWMDEWAEGSKSRFKDCLQHTAIKKCYEDAKKLDAGIHSSSHLCYLPRCLKPQDGIESRQARFVIKKIKGAILITPKY